MRYKRKPSLLKNRLGIIIIIVAVLVLALIIIGSTTSKNKELEANQTQDVDLQDQLEEVIQEEIEQVQTETTEEPKIEEEQEVSKTLKEKGMCEDYNFNEGDLLEIAGYEIMLEKVSTTSARIKAGKTTFFLSPGNDKVIDEELRIELRSGNLHYFGAEDEANTAVLRIGCKFSDEHSSEKYVRERGEDLCEAVYTQCKDSFGIE